MADNTPLNSGSFIGVPSGGTGLGTITDHSVMVGSGAAAVTPIAVGTSGQFLIGWTAADPAFGSSAVADFEFTCSTAGANRELKVVNTDNTNAASHAHVQITTGGASSGDPYVGYSTGVNTKAIGFDNSDSDIFKITTGATPSAGTTHWAMTTSGARTMPLQSAFLAYRTTDVASQTGAGTEVSVHFNAERYDQSGDFSTATYGFTAPVTGRYHFDLGVRLYNLSALSTWCECILNVPNAPVWFDFGSPGAKRNSDNECSLFGSVDVDMDAGDFVDTTIAVDGMAGDTVGIRGMWAATILTTYFSGHLVA